jgi:hypothetical protein
MQKICLTATKNEDWIIHLFLQVMSHIADHIIILDQNSTDDTRNICKRFDKVILLENKSPVFNEPERQKMLIDAARKLFPNEKLLLTFDCDDIPSANILYSKEWEEIIQVASPGAAINLQNICLYGSPYEYKTNRINIRGLSYIPYGMVDNNLPHAGANIHTPRIPFSRNIPAIELKEIVSLHYQFVDVNRALAKQMWYMCYEKLTSPNIPSKKIIERYDWTMRQVHKWKPQKCPQEWYTGWENLGIDLNGTKKQKYFWWTWDVLRYFDKFGEIYFKDLPIWDYDWEKARKEGIESGIESLPQRTISDPRSNYLKIKYFFYNKYFPAKSAIEIIPKPLYTILKKVKNISKHNK